MAQITSGLRAILSNPRVYSTFQALTGAHQGRKTFVSDFVRPTTGMSVLDLGCGPGDILKYLPRVDYWGFDISKEYINEAVKKYGSRGNFKAQLLTINDLAFMPKFDLVLASGVLHHLDEEVAAHLLWLAHEALKPAGRLVTIDPCWAPGQSLLAKFLIAKDRGQNVRTESEYKNLVSMVFKSVKVTVRHKAWIPYTHCFTECTRA